MKFVTIEILESEYLDLVQKADRYERLRGWMSSNIVEGWQEVENLGAIAAWQSWEDFDLYLDSLGKCSLGLMSNEGLTHEEAIFIPITGTLNNG